MKRLVIIVVLVAFAVGVHGQDAGGSVEAAGVSAYNANFDKAMKEAGKELRMFTNQMMIGMGISVVGGGVMAASALVVDNGRNSKNATIVRSRFVTAGGIISVAGAVVTLAAYSHTWKAGRILESLPVHLAVGQDGVGVMVPIR